jgi:hypothetical protein
MSYSSRLFCFSVFIHCHGNVLKVLLPSKGYVPHSIFPYGIYSVFFFRIPVLCLSILSPLSLFVPKFCLTVMSAILRNTSRTRKLDASQGSQSDVVLSSSKIEGWVRSDSIAANYRLDGQGSIPGICRLWCYCLLVSLFVCLFFFNVHCTCICSLH